MIGRHDDTQQVEDQMKTLETTLCLVILLLGALISGGSAMAGDVSGKYFMPSGPSCAVILDSQKKDSVQYAILNQWVGGYLTAYNYVTPNTYNILGKSDLIGAMQWIKNYCEEHPAAGADSAMRYLVIELYPKRIQKKP
jgi:hypothetical protein